MCCSRLRSAFLFFAGCTGTFAILTIVLGFIRLQKGGTLQIIVYMLAAMDIVFTIVTATAVTGDCKCLFYLLTAMSVCLTVGYSAVVGTFIMSEEEDQNSTLSVNSIHLLFEIVNLILLAFVIHEKNYVEDNR